MLVTKGNITNQTPIILEESLSLMTSCMRSENVHAKSSYLLDKEYPNVFNELNSDNIWSLKEKNTVTSALAAYPFKAKINNSIFHAVGIGSVSTHPDHRRRGLSAKLHNEALSYYLRIKHFDFAILWTDMFDYYRKFDYELVGEEVVFIMDSKLKANDMKLEVRPFNISHINAIHSLYQEHENCVDRSLKELVEYTKIPDMHITVALQNNQLVAYTICGKGSDLEATVHEWGGDTQAVLHLLNNNLEREGRTISIISAQNEPILDELTAQGLKPYSGKLGMIRILDVDSFQSKLNINGLKISQHEASNKILIEFYENKTTIDLKTLSRLVFGPETPSEILGDNFRELSHYLPLPFFVWGLDSV